MNALLVAAMVVMGWASQYSPGVMERVIPRQQRYGHLPSVLPIVDGYVAVLDCRRMGEVVLLRRRGDQEWLRFFVADCAGDNRTRAWMLRNNILVELDGATAKRWGTVGRGIRIEMLERMGVHGYN